MSVKSFLSSPLSVLVIILILLELRNLQIVEVDSKLGVSKIVLPSKQFINEDFPEHDSPKSKN